MNVLCMPQAFKGSLKAHHAAQAMAEGVRRAIPNAHISPLPMADGGDDTLDVLIESTGGRYFAAQVQGPTGRPTQARWGVLGDGETAIIEMAQASGIRLLNLHQRDPRTTTTFGTGELIRIALDAGYRKIVIGVGGSATVDGGTGAATALGARFRDARGRELPPGGAALAHLNSIDLRDMRPRLNECSIRIACDVEMPLCGPRGAWRFSFQKGATQEAAEELALALERFAQVVAEQLGVDLRSMPLTGPGGGISGGLHALLGAELAPGADLVLDAIGAKQRIARADLVIIGEGKMDANSFLGKGPGTVAACARRASIPVIAVVGQVGDDVPDLRAAGILEVETLLCHASSEEEARARAWELIAEATQEAIARYARAGGIPAGGR